MNLGWQKVLWTATGVAGSIVAGLALHRILYALGRRLARRRGAEKGDVLLSLIGRPALALLPLVILLGALPALRLPRSVEAPAYHFLELCLIAAFAWLVMALMRYVEHLIGQRYRVEGEDNLLARRVGTQVQLFRRIGDAVICLCALAVMLMTFPAIWSLGASILTSAGIAGLAVGMAAKPALSNLLAGIQLALTEPIRIDDVVIVEGEWGRIEEVNTTYVVVQTWDLRRLIVPLTYFIEKPFQNWTRTSSALIGTVFLYADYAVPVDELRTELGRILEGSPLWDKRTCVLQVTDTKQNCIELRALVSASNASLLFDLRCHVREKLVGFLQTHYPDRLPRTRAEVSTYDGQPSGVDLRATSRSAHSPNG